MTCRRRGWAVLLGIAMLAAVGAAPSAPAQPLSGGGAYHVEHRDEITPEQRARIMRRLETNRAALRATGRLRTPRGGGPLYFDWPLRLAPGFSDPGYHGISNFVDQDPDGPNMVLDYQCGARTYDLPSGYNHQGVDFFLWPFSWNQMMAGAVDIVAVADGTIIDKDDGNDDQSCSFNGNEWNAVYVAHSDGSFVWYGHMKKGSTTAKDVGESVEAGEYLGKVGSSGNSTGPHLHLETYDDDSDLVEPFFGPCNVLNDRTWWLDQRPYYDSAINKLTTGLAPPEFRPCPQPDLTNEDTLFASGAAIVFTSYYRDQLDTQVATHRIRRPDKSILRTWMAGSEAPHFAASYWYWTWTIPAEEPQGSWQYEVDFNGQTYTHGFTISSVTTTSTTSSTTTSSSSSTLVSTTTTTTSSSTTTTTTLFAIDHFLFYAVKATKGQGLPRFVALGPVLLGDQFRSANYNVTKVKELGLPADENRGGIRDPATHLTEYAVKEAPGTPKFTRRRDVAITNECNTALRLEVRKPVSLMIPTNKGLVGPVPAPATTGVDHYLCYSAKSETKLPRGLQVDVADQFETRRWDLKRITKLCNPVSISGSPIYVAPPSKGSPAFITPASIQHPTNYVVCYGAKLARKNNGQASCVPVVPPRSARGLGQSKHTPVVGMHLNNQLGPARLDSMKEIELCLPSLKALLPP